MSRPGASTNLSDKVAIVTGAASGLGLAFAERIAADGAAVMVADMNLAGAEEVASAIVASGGRASSVQTDVADQDSVQRMVDLTIETFGCLDILVSNAGVADLYHFLDQPLDRWNRTLSINLTGVFLCGQAAARAMVKQGRGNIVNIASVAGLRAGSGRSAYGTSKAAVMQLTRQMALDLGPLGINVNAVAPGPVDTPMVMGTHTPETRHAFISQIPLDRYGTPEEIASVVAFLSSDQASYVNGQTIFVDGGFTATGTVAKDVTPRTK